MSRSASSSGRVASTRSMSRSVTADIRRAVSAQPRMPSAERSLVYANPRRCSSMTRMPTPRSPRAITLSIAPSLISIDPDHVDLAHELRTLADQRRAAERLRQLAVADPVALGDLEGEVPRNDVDLTATHLLHEHAVLHRAEDLLRVRRAASDHRVRHPADRQIAERLATRVSASFDAELLGVLPVREVRPQDPLLDEHRPLS